MNGMVTYFNEPQLDLYAYCYQKYMQIFSQQTTSLTIQIDIPQVEWNI